MTNCTCSCSSDLQRLQTAYEGLRKERDELYGALANHLCEHDMADWLACSMNHGPNCDVCDGDEHAGDTSHARLNRAEAAERQVEALKLTVQDRERQIDVLRDMHKANAQEIERLQHLASAQDERAKLIADAAELLRRAPVREGDPWVVEAVEWLRRDGVPGTTSHFMAAQDERAKEGKHGC